ncbi:MAG: glycine cleavage system protein GcvH [Candidatus Marinimicrobia bacterium]|nr:glycine cleavage system protein GcvH [Candidatus Neomarinimicrobiota bacterium]
MNIPADLNYTSDHEWARLEGGSITVGLTDFAQGELGDIIFVEFPRVGDSFAQGDVFGTVEAVKTVADLFMPLSGEITAINAHLEDAPEEVNSDAYGAGWLVKIKFSNPAERDGLLDAAAYKALIA